MAPTKPKRMVYRYNDDRFESSPGFFDEVFRPPRQMERTRTLREAQRTSPEMLLILFGPWWDWRVFQQESPKATLRRIPAVFGPGNAHA